LKFRVAIGFGVGLLGALACGDTTPGSGGAQYGHASSASGPLQVWVVNHPLEYLASRVGGDSIDVVFPAPPDVDPASWSPDPEVILGYQRADLIALNGAGYARWVDRVTLPKSKLVDTSGGFRDRLLPIESSVTHSHGPTGEHTHGELASTFWLDPSLATDQARALEGAFGRARPEQREHFRGNQERLAAELAALDARLEHAAGLLGGRPILYSHPVYQYLQGRYSLNGRALHWEPDEAPSEAMWRELEEVLASHPARLMLWEGEPSEEVKRRLASLGIESVLFDPAGNGRGDDGWLATMQSNAERLEGVAAGQ
jgi:zinc transport system substrate-binding protein